MTSNPLKIIPYTKDRAKEIARLFHNAVHNIDSCDYNEAQKAAWAPTPIDYQRWIARLDIKQPFLAIINNTVAGFLELEANGHIDCAYAHPEYQRQGIATALLKHAEKIAIKQGFPRLYVEASLLAKPFFASHGFTTLSEQKVAIRGQKLINFNMEKRLASRKETP